MKILDNILLASELIKWYGRKCLSPRGVLKIDLRKAYVSVEWPFSGGDDERVGFA